MLIPEITYTFAEVALPFVSELTLGEHALLLVLDEHDAREELVWVQVTECLQASTYRARTVRAAECFPDLPPGEVVYFRPEHVVQVRPGGAHGLSSLSGAVLA